MEKNKNILTLFNTNVNILFIVFILFSLLNTLIFFWGMNGITTSLDNSYVMFKGKKNGNEFCYALKATRNIKDKNIDRTKLDSLNKLYSTTTKKVKK
jgi:hypothetical protein